MSSTKHSVAPDRPERHSRQEHLPARERGYAVRVALNTGISRSVFAWYSAYGG